MKFEESMTILNSRTKKVWKLIEFTTYTHTHTQTHTDTHRHIYIYIYIYLFIYIFIHIYIYIYDWQSFCFNYILCMFILRSVVYVCVCVEMYLMFLSILTNVRLSFPFWMFSFPLFEFSIFAIKKKKTIKICLAIFLWNYSSLIGRKSSPFSSTISYFLPKFQRTKTLYLSYSPIILFVSEFPEFNTNCKIWYIFTLVIEKNRLSIPLWVSNMHFNLSIYEWKSKLSSGNFIHFLFFS